MVHPFFAKQIGIKLAWVAKKQLEKKPNRDLGDGSISSSANYRYLKTNSGNICVGRRCPPGSSVLRSTGDSTTL